MSTYRPTGKPIVNAICKACQRNHDELQPFLERLEALVETWQRQAREHEGNCDMALDAYADAQEACAAQLRSILHGEQPK